MPEEQKARPPLPPRPPRQRRDGSATGTDARVSPLTGARGIARSYSSDGLRPRPRATTIDGEPSRRGKPRRARSTDGTNLFDDADDEDFGSEKATVLDSITAFIGPDPEEVRKRKEEARRKKEEAKAQRLKEKEEAKAKKEEEKKKKRLERSDSKKKKVEEKRRSEIERLQKEVIETKFAKFAKRGEKTHPTEKDAKKAEFGEQPNIRAVPMSKNFDPENYQPPVFAKNDNQKALIRETATNTFVFKDVMKLGTATDVERLVKAFKPVTAKVGQTIVKRGDDGKEFFLVQEGKVDFVNRKGEVVGSAEAGNTFGEMNMLFSAPEQADIVVSNDHDGPTKLLKVDQETFRGIMQTSEANKIRASKERKAATQEGEKYVTSIASKKASASSSSWLSSSKVLQQRKAISECLSKHVSTIDKMDKISVLGEGQFGEVWLVETHLPGIKGYDKSKGGKKKRFALKCQSTEDESGLRGDKKDTMDAIQSEIDVMNELVHPFIACLYHTYKSDDSMDMVLGLIPGGELWDLVHKEDPKTGEWTSGMPAKHAQFYGMVVADTLGFIHSQRYVFRDLKNENIMIDSKGYPVIVDFGFAKKLKDSDPKTYTFCGTPNYVAPEIVKNSGHGFGADYWALGVVIYEMVTGDNPFWYDGIENFELFQMIVNDKHEPLPKKFAGEAHLKELIDKLLEKDPSKRLGCIQPGLTQDILEHKWFSHLDISELRQRKVKAPYIPGDSNNVDDDDEIWEVNTPPPVDLKPPRMMDEPVPERPKSKPGEKKATKPKVGEVVKRVANPATRVNPETFKAPVHKKDLKQAKIIQAAAENNYVLNTLATGASKDVQALIKAFEEINAKKGDTIVKQGDLGKHMYVVEEGEVEFRVNGITIGTAKAGESFGEENLLFDHHEKASVVATSAKTKLQRLENTVFRGLAQTTEENKAPVEEKKEAHKENWLARSKVLQERDAIKRSLKKYKNKTDDLERIRVLGEGQFGEVWLVQTKLPDVAKWEKKPKKFALKCQSKDDATTVDMIRDEAKAMDDLKHPFLAYLYYTYESEDSLDMLLGLIPGGELWDLIHKEDPVTGEWESGLPVKHAQFYGLVITDALAYIHGQKYVYRDMKPENVMIDGKGYPMIVDFGFAKKLVKTDKTFTFCGTPNYVSPEIIRNSGHNAGADYWALGCVIYEMVTGENPFWYDDLEQSDGFRMVCDDPYEPLKKEHETKALKNLLDGLLEKDFNYRLGMLTGKAQDILDHEWFADLDLAMVRAKKVKAPWIPAKSEDEDEDFYEDEEVEEDLGRHKPKEPGFKPTKPPVLEPIRPPKPIKIDPKTFKAPVHLKDFEQKETIIEAAKDTVVLKELVKGADKDVQTLIKAFEPVEAKQGETLVKEGDSGKHLYVVEKGRVEFLVDGITVGFATAGQTFGEQNLLFEGKEKATIVAKSDDGGPTKLLRVDQATFKGIAQTTEAAKKPKPKPTPKPEKENWLEGSSIIKKREAIRKSLKQHVSADHLERISVLGEGQFGEVWLVATKLPGVPGYENKKKKFALKCQNKVDELGDDTALDMIRSEIEVMEKLVHPFIAYLYRTYESETSLDMLLGLIPGGELWDVVHKENPDTGEWDSGIPVEHAKFYAMGITDALGFIHKQQYIFRDLKPENIMIDGKGYPMIVDFGFAKKCTDKRYTFCGTPNYVSPEIIKNIGHHAACDYWALGCVIYEMVTGENPFYYEGLDQMDLYHAISEEAYEPIPKQYRTDELVDLIERLLEKDQDSRLGVLENGANDVLEHPWFDGLDLKKIRKKKIPAPWIPDDNGDVSDEEELGSDDDGDDEVWEEDDYHAAESRSRPSAPGEPMRAHRRRSKDDVWKGMLDSSAAILEDKDYGTGVVEEGHASKIIEVISQAAAKRNTAMAEVEQARRNAREKRGNVQKRLRDAQKANPRAPSWMMGFE